MSSEWAKDAVVEIYHRNRKEVPAAIADALDAAYQRGLAEGTQAGLTDWKLHACEYITAQQEGWRLGYEARQAEEKNGQAT